MLAIETAPAVVIGGLDMIQTRVGVFLGASGYESMITVGGGQWRRRAARFTGEFAEYRALAELLAECCPPAVRVVGLSGAQGTGKSTLARLFEQALSACGRQPATLSLDDYYLPRAERQRLAAECHQLFQTRGVPGSHDIEALLADIDALRSGSAREVPLFDKGRDDRLARRRHIPAGCDIVIVEGWCVGVPAAAEGELAAPLNDLERNEDPDGVWRRRVDQALAGAYTDLTRRLDALVFLQAPSFAQSAAWRADQERERPPAQRMSGRELARFMAHYERLARRALAVLPARADAVVVLGEGHAIERVTLRGAFRVDSDSASYAASHD